MFSPTDITTKLQYPYKGTGSGINPLKHTVHYILPRGAFRNYVLSDSRYLFVSFDAHNKQANISLNDIGWFIFIMHMQSAFCDLETFLYIIRLNTTILMVKKMELHTTQNSREFDILKSVPMKIRVFWNLDLPL